MLQYFQHRSILIFDDQVYYFDGQYYSSNEAHILYMIGLKRYFKSLGFCARLDPTPDSASYTIPPEIKVIPLPCYDNIVDLCIRFSTYTPKIWRILEANIKDYDFLLLSWPHPISLMALVIARIKYGQNVPTFVVRQNLRKLVKLRYRGVRKAAASLLVSFLEWQLRLWGRGAVIFAVGDEMYDEFRGTFPRVHLVALPLLSKNHVPQPRSTNAAAGGAPTRLLFVGRLEPEKGLPYLIQCLATLNKAGKKFHLDIVGSGSEEDNLRALSQNLNVGGEVSFRGYVAFGEPLFSYYRATDIFVLPSLSEGAPNVLMEAMAFGVPIVTTRTGGIGGIIRHKENGLLVEPASAAALSEAITSLINEPQLAAALRAQAMADSHICVMEPQQERMLEVLARSLGVGRCA